jgi:RimJ/RimL family protein N-acetyltransferase
LPALFAGIESRRVDRLFYRLRLDTPVAPPFPPDGFTLRQIDAALVAESTLANHQPLIAEMQSETPSVEDFLRGRFGYCLQHGHELIAWCLSEYNHGDRCELGIETLPPFRRRGLALVTARDTLAHAQAHGVTTIGWHCWKHNVASSNLAQRLGFELVEEYPVWYCRFAQYTAV